MSNNDVKIQIPNGYLNVYKEDAIALSFLNSDVREPESKSGGFSKTIKIPGDANNNYLLGLLFDINSSFKYNNPNLRTDCKLLVNSNIIMNGYMRILRVVNKNDNNFNSNESYYEIKIFEEVSNIFKKMGEGKLEDLDFSSYDHTYSYTNITNSWSNTYKDVYTYPMLYKADSLTWKTENWTPGIFHKAYLKKIASHNGFAIGGSFMDDSSENGAIYNKEIIPYNGDLQKLGEAERSRREFQAGLTTATMSYYGYTHSTYQPFGSSGTGFDKQIILDDDTTSPNFDNATNWDISLGRWTADRSGKFDLSGDFKLRVTFDSGGTNAWLNYLIFGGHPQEATSGVLSNLTGAQDGSVQVKFQGTVYVKKNGSTVIGSSLINYNVQLPGNLGANNLPSSAALNSTNNWQRTVDISFINQDFFLGAQVNKNDYFDFYIKLQSVSNKGGSFVFQNSWYSYINQTNKNVPVSINVDVLKTVSGVTDCNIRNKSLQGSLIDGDDISLNDYVPKDFLQKDLFIDVIKRYNLFVTQDSRTGKILLDTRDDYYDSGEILNYTDKKDYNKQDEITILSRLQKKEYEFTYSEDEDYANKTYTEDYEEIFGKKLVEFDNNFTSGRKKIETPMSPTPTADNGKGLLLPYIKATNLSANLAPRCKPRVLYFAGLQNTYNNTQWTFQYIDSNGVNQTATYTKYPMALHTDSALNPTIDLNYGRAQGEFYSQSFKQTNNNLYNRYWLRTIQTLDESKMVTSYFKLNENDIYYLKNNMNVTLFIKDSYYYINKIIDYNPNQNGLTKIELIKKVEGTKTFRSRFDFNVPIKAGGDIKADFNTGYGGVTQDNNNYSASSYRSGNNNTIPKTSEDVIIVGDNNTIDNNVRRSGILGGSNNRISGNNSWIIGADYKNVTLDREIWIGDLHIIDGVLQSSINRIAGPVDAVNNPFSPSIINRIDGGVDEVYEQFPENPINIINGGVDSV